MYAVIAAGGKQYRVSEGDKIHIEHVPGEPGEDFEFEEVLFVGGEDGSEGDLPPVEKVKVVGKIVEQTKGDKVIVFKFKRRKMYRRKQGHRQLLTTVQIDDISAEKAKKSGKPAAEKSSPAKAKKKIAEETASREEAGEE